MSNLRVCIWPDDLQTKDVNDMIKKGMTMAQVKAVVDSHTFQGLEAEVEFNRWVRI